MRFPTSKRLLFLTLICFIYNYYLTKLSSLVIFSLINFSIFSRVHIRTKGILEKREIIQQNNKSKTLNTKMFHWQKKIYASFVSFRSTCAFVALHLVATRIEIDAPLSHPTVKNKKLSTKIKRISSLTKRIQNQFVPLHLYALIFLLRVPKLISTYIL